MYVQWTNATLYNNIEDNMMVSDGLVPIWCQAICNHHDDIGLSVYIKDVINIMKLQFYVICQLNRFGARAFASSGLAGNSHIGTHTCT